MTFTVLAAILVGCLVGVQYVATLLQFLFAAVVHIAGGTPRSDAQRLSKTRVSNSGITVLVPAHNEAPVVVATVEALLAQSHPQCEIIVIADGCTDDTVLCLTRRFDLRRSEREPTRHTVLHYEPINQVYESPACRNLALVDKGRGGKGDALNCGLAMARFPLVCVIDADTILDTQALLRAASVFDDDPAERIVGAGASVLVERRRVNGCPGQLLRLLQTVEYARAFACGRLSSSAVNAAPVIAGAFGVFRKDVLFSIGGYDTMSKGEDIDLVFRLHREMGRRQRPYRIVYVPEAMCWTKVPHSLALLSKQRQRWQEGALDAFGSHPQLLLNPHYGTFGLLAMPYVLIVDVLGPFLELLGYCLIPLFLWFGITSLQYIAAVYFLLVAMSIFVTWGCICMEEIRFHRFRDPSVLLMLAVTPIVEAFGYRQLSSCWRMVGWHNYAKGRLNPASRGAASWDTQRGVDTAVFDLLSRLRADALNVRPAVGGEREEIARPPFHPGTPGAAEVGRRRSRPDREPAARVIGMRDI